MMDGYHFEKQGDPKGENLPLLKVHTLPATQAVHPVYSNPPHLPHFSTVHPPEEALVVAGAAEVVVVLRVVEMEVVVLEEVVTAVVDRDVVVVASVVVLWNTQSY